jgi:hypothetical protein
LLHITMEEMTPYFIFLNLNGTLIHQVTIRNAKNVDWEDISSDGKHTLFIGDIGNNNNKRKDLCIYRVNSQGILDSTTVVAEKIRYNYPEQLNFPPNKHDLYYDAEALAYYRDSLYVLTKCRTEPFDGKSFWYILPSKNGTYTARKTGELLLGEKGIFSDAITAADIVSNTLYVLTYNRLMEYDLDLKQFDSTKTIRFRMLSQKEAVAIDSKGAIFVADERHRILGGGKLYKIK